MVKKTQFASFAPSISLPKPCRPFLSFSPSLSPHASSNCAHQNIPRPPDNCRQPIFAKRRVSPLFSSVYSPRHPLFLRPPHSSSACISSCCRRGTTRCARSSRDEIETELVIFEQLRRQKGLAFIKSHFAPDFELGRRGFNESFENAVQRA